VFASDRQKLTAKMEDAIASRVFDGVKKPTTGTWEQIEERLDEAADTLWSILHDIAGDQ
jgi:hypothetical protein